MKLLAAILAGALTGPTGQILPDDVRAQGVADQVDAGAELDARGAAIYARCEDFAPDAGDVARELDGGAVLLSPARARYDACRIGAGAKCSQLLEQPDAGAAVDSTKSNLWIVTSAICALSGVFTAYANNRTARHLGLWP